MKRNDILCIAIAGSFGCVGMTACERAETPTEETPTTPAPQTAQEVDVEDVAEQPQEFHGKTVTLAGEVDDVYSDRAFALEGNDWIGDEEVLVVARSPIMLGQGGPQDDDDIIVTGKVRRQMITEIEREIGWDLGPELELEFEDRPIVVAESIRQTGDIAQWSAQDEPEGVIVTTWTIEAIPDPSALEGRKLNLTAVPVQAKAGDGLWIGFSHVNQMFVEPPEDFDTQGVQVGDKVDVTGTFQKMPPADEAMKQWNFDPGLEGQIAEEVVYIEAKEVSKAKEQPEKEKHASAQQQDEKSEVAFEAQGGMLQPKGETISLEAFASSPGEYTGRAVQGQAKVLEVPSDRGFWLEMPEGQKVFALIHEEDPEHDRIDINPGDQVKFTAVALESKQASELPLPIEKDAEDALKGQEAFLAVHWKDIEKVSQRQ